MKTVGIIRRVDEVGRISLPSDLRAILNIDNRDYVEIFSEDEKIIIKKHKPSCIFCGETENISEYKNKQICAACLKELTKL